MGNYTIIIGVIGPGDPLKQARVKRPFGLHFQCPFRLQLTSFTHTRSAMNGARNEL